MDSIKIYSSDGALLIDAVLEDSSAQDWGIMSENQVSLDFYTDECIILPASCYIDYEGQRFWLLDEYKPTENNSAEWSYQVRFLGAESLLAVTVVLNQTDGSDEPIFNLTAPASQHLEFIVSNLNRRFPGMGWSVGSVPSTENIFIEYAGTYASDALQTIVGDKYEWWVDDFVVNIGRCEFGERIELGYQNGLLGGITYSTANEMRSYAYLYPIGSTRNIDPSKYGYSRLQLPDGLTRIDINPEQGLAELVESDAFADIFPRYVGKVTAVRTSSGKNEDGTSFTIYHIKDSSIPFNPNNYEIAGEVKQITFQSGELMGAEFEVNYDADNKEFEIITQFQNGGLSQLPDGALIPKVGDKYVVWNISMPDEYYPLAEQEFLQAALAFASESVKEASVYRAPVDFIEVQQRGLRLRPGQRVRLLSNEYFPDKGYYDSRITRITRDVCYPDEITIEVSSVVSKGTISRLRNFVNDSATKVASLGQSLKNYVDVMSPQSVRGVKNFVNGLSIGGVGLWRHPDGYVYLDETLVLKGGVVMFGNSSGVNVPSIFDSLPIDKETIKRDGNGALYVDETALKINGGGGVADSVYWTNIIGKPSWIGSTKPTYKYSEIEERPDLSVYAKLTDIPSLNGYATQTWVEGKGYLLATTASDTYQPKITTTNKLAYSLISNTPDLSVYALNTDVVKKWTQNDAKIANWDSAYSWGNHANAGYAKASDVTNEFKNYVKLAGDSQSITAQHNFANGLKIGGISLRKVDDYLYLDSSLVLSGGVTMYGDDGTTVKPIWESIPFDRTTIDWVNGMWTVVGGVGSGGISEEFLNVKLQEYQPLLSATNKLPYSLISGTPDLSVYFLKSSFTKANIKSTLGISDWALASTKPTYTASEVGALGVNDTATNANKLDGYLPTTYMRASGQYTDSLNDLTSLGIYRMSGTITDGPTGAGGYGNLMVVRSNNWDTLSQLYFNANNNRIFVRSGTNSNFTSKDWSTLAYISDIPTKLSQLTDDLVAGNYLSTKGGTINGSLTAPSFIGNLTGNVIANSLCVNSQVLLKYTADDYKFKDVLSFTWSSDANDGIKLSVPGWHTEDTFLHLTALKGAMFSHTVTASTFIGALQGNADSATTMSSFAAASDDTTKRYIWMSWTDNSGKPAYSDKLRFQASTNTLFSTNFAGNLTGDTANIGTLQIITNEINGANGTGNAHINYSSTGKVTIANGGGNVAIGGTTANAKLHVHGTAKFTGDTTFSSKVVIGTIPVYQSTDGTLFVDANVVFRGGVAMYGDATTTINEE